MSKFNPLIFLFTLAYSFAIAQSPQQFSYQAVVRDNNNNLISNRTIGMRVSILKDSTNGQSAYTETHSPKTNQQGIVQLNIGGGTVVSGSFTSVPWSSGKLFVKTEMDLQGGANYIFSNTTQLLSVPFALFSNDIPVSVSSSGDTLSIGSRNIIIPGISNANPIVTDGSGNTYPIIKIGSQTWMTENLRTTKYSDGSNIPIITDNVQWANNINNFNNLPMMCWYNNDQGTYTTNKFGALYNWYAINPTTNGNKNVCPKGWHVPTDTEWTTLINFLGGEFIAGGKMKSTGTQYWTSPNNGASNSSGFSGLPGGYRNNEGPFANVGNVGTWWSSTESAPADSWNRDVVFSNSGITRNYRGKPGGFSVRCIKD